MLKRYFKKTNRKGLGIIEIIIATGIFTVVLAGIVPLYLGVFDSNLRDINKMQADMLLQQGLEGVRSIRDQNFSNLVNGTYGLSRTAGYWAFSGSSDVSGKFTRTVTIADIMRNTDCDVVASGGTVDANSKKITVTLTWDYKPGDSATVSAVEYLTNWSYQQGCEQASNFVIDLSGIALSSADARVIGITLRNIGPSPITIDKIKITWTNSKLVEEVKIGSQIVWKYNNTGTPTGKQPSGTQLDIVNFTLSAYSPIILLDHFLFTGSMDETTFTIYFTMTDGSVRYEQVYLDD